jgi:hypothetical protein
MDRRESVLVVSNTTSFYTLFLFGLFLVSFDRFWLCSALLDT